MPYNSRNTFSSSSSHDNITNAQQQHHRRLSRLSKLRYLTDDDIEIGTKFNDIDRRTFSLPCSPERMPGRKNKLMSPDGIEHWSLTAVPKPLPLPDVFLNRRSKVSPGSSQLEERLVASSGRRKNADEAAKTTAKSFVHNKGFSHDEPIESFTNGPKSRVAATRSTRGVTSFYSTPASPRRSNNQHHFHSCDVAADSANSLLSRRRGFSRDNYGHVNRSLRLNVHTRSAPPTACISPSVSPPRSTTMDHFPSRRVEWHENNPQVNGYPLPLPPGALPSSQPTMQALQSPVLNRFIEKPIVTPMISQWHKGKLLGRGTYGSVYEATNRETGALCAMKEVDIIPDDPKSLECVQQLEQEISVLRHLNHPNIVRYYGSERVDDHFYIYLEYVHPGSINRYIREHCGAITETMVRNFTRHILSGLAFLHSSKTIHRDIKGANLLVDANGVVKLADFGMAKHITGLSYELSLKGSPYWMAPEVIRAVMQKDSDPDLALAVDIWSVGCTVIEMLNGKPPWSELQGPQAMFKVLNTTPPIPETLSPEGKDFLGCCFRRNPAERPPAAMLLEHPFVRNSADQNGSILMQAVSRLNVTENSSTPRNIPTHKSELKSTSPSTRITKGKPTSNSKAGQLRHVKTTNGAVASHLSTHEVSTHTSATRFISHSFSPSSHVSRNMPHGAVNNHPCSVGRTRGKEIQYI